MPTPNVSDLQFFLRALDRYGNALFELGNQDSPERLALVGSGVSTAAASPSGNDVNRTPFFVTAGSLAVLGLAAGGVATATYLRREEAARDWNGKDCEQPGATRQQQCGDVDTRRRHAETMTIGFASAGGALLLGSVFTLMLAPSSRSNTSVAVQGAPGSMMLRLRTAL